MQHFLDFFLLLPNRDTVQYTQGQGHLKAIQSTVSICRINGKVI